MRSCGRGLVLPLAFQQFSYARGGRRIRCAHARRFVAGFSFCSVTGRADYVYLQFIYGWLYDRDEHPGCLSTMERAIQVSLEKIFAYVLRISALVSAMFCLAALFLPQQLMRLFLV